MQIKIEVILKDQVTREEAQEQLEDGSILEIIDHPQASVFIYFDDELVDQMNPEDEDKEEDQLSIFEEASYE